MNYSSSNDGHDENFLPSPIQAQHLIEREETQKRGDAIVRNIASFLTLSDAASIASGFALETPTVESWALAGGTPYQWSPAETPPTPALVAISPHLEGGYNNMDLDNSSSFQLNDSLEESCSVADIHREQRSRASWAQERLAAAIFSHPEPMREYCLEAYSRAKDLQLNQGFNMVGEDSSPTALQETADSILLHRNSQHTRHKNDPTILLRSLIDHVLNNIPLSIALDVLDGLFEVSLDTSLAVVRLTSMSIQGIIHALIRFVGAIWDGVTHFNPLALVQAVMSRPFNAMNKTTEVVVSGIQSVATGVGSASSLAFHRLSAAKNATSSSSGHQNVLRLNRMTSPKLNQKLIRKLSTMNDAASVVSYTEVADDTGGLSRRAKSRVVRMMHYSVSLRPFRATVKVPSIGATRQASPQSSIGNSNIDYNNSDDLDESGSVVAEESSTCSSPESPFMCTPQSFPPTPSSRRVVLARGTRFADDVIFLARDKLRVHDALGSQDERTREMAVALTQGNRLALFDADDAGAGIDLTCGQHVATKVGAMLYCSSRSMVPVLRNCFVYFEMAVLPQPSGSLVPQASLATLSIGLSTKEMPSNTLVGAWKGSVGLCTTGQMLTAGQWCSPADPSLSSYGDRATVGCLVWLDDGSAFETWDGVMVRASVTFNVNERIVGPPVSSLPMAPPTPIDGDLSATTPVGSTSTMDLGSTPPPISQPVLPSFTLPLLVPAEEELYPTVTLHSPGTSVICRFSAGDIVASSREVMGAPPGVTVYAVDGGIILNDSD